MADHRFTCARHLRRCLSRHDRRNTTNGQELERSKRRTCVSLVHVLLRECIELASCGRMGSEVLLIPSLHDKYELCVDVASHPRQNKKNKNIRHPPHKKIATTSRVAISFLRFVTPLPLFVFMLYYIFQKLAMGAGQMSGKHGNKKNL